MNRFFWKITICVVPLLLSAWVVGRAFYNYSHGQGGFKLGVDLVGGTILIYEVDIDKFPDHQLPKDWKPQELAARLKSRIDPGDLYNITVRVASNTRFEIILPTGGELQMKAQEEAWKERLREVARLYPLKERRYSVKVGDVEGLVKEVQSAHLQVEGKPADVKDIEQFIKEIYPYKTTDTPPTAEQQRDWKELLEKISKKYPPPSPQYSVPVGHTIELIAEVDAQHHKEDPKEEAEFVAELEKEIARLYPFAKTANPPTAEQKEKWQKLLRHLSAKYPIEEYVAGRGKTGELTTEVTTYYPNADLSKIAHLINPDVGRKRGKRGLSMSQEQVQERKELIAQVGLLEFKILANKANDKDALSAATRYFEDATKDKKLQEELRQLALQGKPPPPPTPATGETFSTPLGDFKYSWVELSANYRFEHGFANPRDSKGALIPPPPEDKDPDFKKKKEEWDRLHKAEWEAALRKPQSSEYDWAAELRRRGLADFIPTRFKSADEKEVDQPLLYSRVIPPGRPLTDKDRDKVIEYFVLTRDAESPAKRVTGDFVSSASPGMQGEVTFRIKPGDASKFQEFTSRNRGHLMAIVLDGAVESSATIKEAISSNGQITGNFTPDKIDALVKVLRSGSLPATLKPEPVSENTMGPTLGVDTIRKGFYSVVWAFVAVLAFMLVYYRFAGFVACVALLANLLMTVAFMVAIDATFTLPGLAGLVLMLGMAVDANVLIYERLREERERGMGLTQAIRNGYDHALPTIIDTHLSSIFTAIVLYVVGNDQLKGFGISLTVGLIISLFTSLYMTRLMFDYWQAKGWLKNLTMLRLFHKPNINFMAIRYYWFTATVILTVLGAALFIWRLPEGSSGSVAETELTRALTRDQMRQKLAEAKLPDLTVEPIGDTAAAATKTFALGTTDKDEKRVREKVAEALKDEEGKSLVKEMTVSPRASQKSALNIDFTGGTAYGGELTRPVSIETLRDLLERNVRPEQRLPDLSVEQIFISAPGYSEGDKSKLFTVRTSEKNVKVVQDKINKFLVDEDGESLLKRLNLSDYVIEPDNKEVYLAFIDPKTKAPTFASRAQVSMLLNRELKENDLEASAQQLTLVGLGPEKDGRFQWMKGTFLDPVKDRAKLESALKDTQVAFRDNPQPERLENFDSQLAEETQLRALYAIVASWGAILLYLWFRFGNWTFGLAAVLCLIHDLFFTLGIIAACHYVVPSGFAHALALEDFKIDLPTVAALLTLVGYSTNDTIVVFDRIREVRGKNPNLTAQMINDSVNQTLSRTVLASLATWLVVLVLYIWGGEGVHLFAFVMVVGVIVGTYSSIYIASPLLLMFGEGRSSTETRDRAPQPAAEPRA